jgi:hypothetical protein
MCAQAPAADPLMQAMHDEVDRSVKLNCPTWKRPISWSTCSTNPTASRVSASLGGLLSRSRDHFRVPEVHVRVGDYKFDNTNFAGGGAAADRATTWEAFPLDNDYPVMRRYLWLETDSVYKGAVEAISRKRAAMRNINQNDQLNDFAHAEPVHFIKPFQKLTLDEKTWVTASVRCPALFAQYPDVKTSQVELHADNGGYYVVNSEGTEVQDPENVAYVRAAPRRNRRRHDPARRGDFHALDAAICPPRRK